MNYVLVAKCERNRYERIFLFRSSKPNGFCAQKEDYTTARYKRTRDNVRSLRVVQSAADGPVACNMRTLIKYNVSVRFYGATGTFFSVEQII